MLITYFQVLFKISFSNERGSDQFQTRYVSSKYKIKPTSVEKKTHLGTRYAMQVNEGVTVCEVLNIPYISLCL